MYNTVKLAGAESYCLVRADVYNDTAYIRLRSGLFFRVMEQ